MSDPSTHAGFQAPDIQELTPLFPGYEIQCLIACGGMGAVYRAVQRSLDRTVALKILPREFTSDAAFCAGFESEAKAMAKLNHPNLIGVYDFGEADGMLFIIMEYVPGQSLYHSAHGQAVDPQEVIRLVTGICNGLAHAHDHGIIHRDIKPANVLLDLNAQPKIGDFGLARPQDRKDEAGEEIFGTPHYTAPEVVGAPQKVDTRADLFSVGVVLHELLTGKLPADDPRPASTIIRCDPRFDAIIRRATHPSPEMRYRSASEIAAELQVIASSAGPRVLRTAASSGPAAPVVRRPAVAVPVKSSSGMPSFVLPVLFAAIAIAALYYFVKKSEVEEARILQQEEDRKAAQAEAAKAAEEAAAQQTASVVTPTNPLTPSPDPRPLPTDPDEDDEDDADETTSEGLDIPGVTRWRAVLNEWKPRPDGGIDFSVSSGDIWNNADSGAFQGQTWTGNGIFTLRVGAIQGATQWCKAGLMIREDLDDDARNVFLTRSARKGNSYQLRATHGGTTTQAGADASNAEYLRIQRTGDELTAFVSADGTAWTRLATATISGLTESIHVGFAASGESGTHASPATGWHAGLDARAQNNAIFDVPGFLARARGIMRDRAKPILEETEKQYAANCDEYAKKLKRHIRRSNQFAYTRDRADAYVDLLVREMDRTKRLDATGGERWMRYFYTEEAIAIRAEHIELEGKITEGLNAKLKELSGVYITGIELQIGRLDATEDPVAIELLQTEIQQTKLQPDTFLEWVSATE